MVGQEGEEGAGPTPFFLTRLTFLGGRTALSPAIFWLPPFKINNTNTVPSGSNFDINSINSYFMLNA